MGAVAVVHPVVAGGGDGSGLHMAGVTVADTGLHALIGAGSGGGHCPVAPIMAQGGDLFRFLHATAAAHLALFSIFRTGRKRFRVVPIVIKLLFHRVSFGDPGVINNYVVIAILSIKIFSQFSVFICASSDVL